MSKFSEDKKYIQMCRKAEEIQALWTPQKGDLFSYADYVYTIGDCSIDTDTIKTIGCGCCSHSIINYQREKEKKNAIWLPRQDELQEMMLDKFGGQQISLLYYFIERIKEKRPFPFEIDTCIESVWLAFVMKQKFNKTWDDKAGEWE